MRIIKYCLAIGLSFSTVAMAEAARNEVTGISRPSQERKLTFNAPGLVKEALVKDGDVVKAGQPLLQLDDEFDRKELDRLKLEAESDARIDANTADMDAKKVILDRKLKTLQEGGANQSEVDEAKLNVTVAEKQVQLAHMTQDQAKLDAAKQAIKLSRMTLKAPADGIVEKVNTQPGEWADPQGRDGAISFVQNDPIYIEVKELTTRQVSMLKPGEKLKVRYSDDKEDAWKDAEIFFFAPVSDASSGTRMIKLKLTNAQNRDSGLQMMVQIPPEVADAGNSFGATAVGK